jgi:alkanesulfonate monooxygenase SsuD/methylene tetrahydromethanopterin reductase-like flavin-dependent oxidoreductase (luciferase family)
MRALWAEELVTIDGQWHRIPDAGINPLPPRRSIPIWMGGESEVVVRRAARLADGWMPHFRPRPESQAIVDGLHQLVRDAGRDPGQFGIEGRMTLSQMPPAEWAAELKAWRTMRGITHLCVNTMGMGLATPEDHSRMLERFKKEAMG